MKKIVHYKGEASPLILGYGTYVFPVDHPDKDNVSNTKEVHTSTVVRIGENGEFETLNTIYRKQE